MRPALASLLFALSLSAQYQPVLIDPPGPTSATPVTAAVYVTCDPVSHTLVRTGNTIKIDVTPGPFTALCDPPVGVRHEAPIGVLPAGQYRIDVTVNGSSVVEASRMFIVRGAGGAFEVHPSAVPTSANDLTMRIDAKDLPDVTKIVVGGMTIDPQSITRDGSTYSFRPPQLPVGLANLSIETAAGTHTFDGAVYSYDRDQPPDPSVFERMLFPVLFSTEGTHGSRWVSEVAVANVAPWTIPAYNEILDGPPCNGCQFFAPEDTQKFNGAGYPGGAALIVPRGDADELAFSLRVRDTSRTADGYGTQVPVLREKDMFRESELTLLNVPLDPAHRTKLRIYALDFVEQEAYVTVNRVSAPNVAAAYHLVPMNRSCTSSRCAATPWYGELDLPSDEADGNVNVYVTAPYGHGLVWAFASITNNETQQVTVVTADGNGGRP